MGYMTTNHFHACLLFFMEQEIRRSIRPNDPHFAHTSLVCLENTQNRCGGRVLPSSYIKSVSELCHEYGLRLHVDGARIFNACVALNETPLELNQHVDSISVCFSKGLGAPVGSVLVGPDDFISKVNYRFINFILHKC